MIFLYSLDSIGGNFKFYFGLSLNRKGLVYCEGPFCIQLIMFLGHCGGSLSFWGFPVGALEFYNRLSLSHQPASQHPLPDHYSQPSFNQKRLQIAQFCSFRWEWCSLFVYQTRLHRFHHQIKLSKMFTKYSIFPPPAKRKIFFLPTWLQSLCVSV